MDRTIDIFNFEPTGKKEESLDEQFQRERIEWSEKIKSMSAQIKKTLDMAELMTTVYTDRQQCLEYYHYLLSILIRLNVKYRKEYAEKYDFWTTKSQIRYPNESTKVNKILSEMSKIHEEREVVENHSKYMLNTISTIDNIIYAIPRRIDLEHLSRGDK
jgi:hypothetical protein